MVKNREWYMKNPTKQNQRKNPQTNKPATQKDWGGEHPSGSPLSSFPKRNQLQMVSKNRLNVMQYI